MAKRQRKQTPAGRVNSADLAAHERTPLPEISTQDEETQHEAFAFPQYEETQTEETTRQATPQNSTEETLQQAAHKIFWTILLAFLFFLQLLGIAGLGTYCYQTTSCAITVHVPHYHCENGTSGISYDTAMKVELAFVITELFSRAFLLAFCFKLEGLSGVKDIFSRLL